MQTARQENVFCDTHTGTPVTQGIKYIGSKLKLLPHILSLVDGLRVESVFDGFSGSTRVSQAFAQLGYRVTSNDTADWSRTFGVCFLKNRERRAYYEDLINHLNALRGYDGWFTEHYGGLDHNGCAVQKDGGKRPWQIHNTRKLDAIRDEIDALDLRAVEKAVALTALIMAMDEVDNTLGHYSSYLKDWSPRSYKNMRLKVPHVFPNDLEHQVIQGDVFDALDKVAADFCYFDPPYGSSNEKMPPSRVRYAAYYHVWKTIVMNDKPALFGKVARRADTSDALCRSVFEEFRKDDDGRFISVKAVDRLIQSAQSTYIALSYNANGRATREEMRDVISKHGKLLKVVEVDHKTNVMARMHWTNEWLNDHASNRECLFLIEK